jgi:hypothetical protein
MSCAGELEIFNGSNNQISLGPGKCTLKSNY